MMLFFFFNWPAVIDTLKSVYTPPLHQGCGIFIFYKFYGDGRQKWHVWMVDNLILQRHLLPYEEIWLIYETILLYNPLSLPSGNSDLDLTSIKHQQSDFTDGHKT